MSHGHLDLSVERAHGVSDADWTLTVAKLRKTPYRWERDAAGDVLACSIPAGWFGESASGFLDDLASAGIDLATCVASALWSYDCDWCVRELVANGSGAFEREHVLGMDAAGYVPPFDTSRGCAGGRRACAELHPELAGMTLMLSGTLYADSGLLADDICASLESQGLSARTDPIRSDPCNVRVRFDADEMSVIEFLDRLEAALRPFPATTCNAELDFERACEEDEASGGNMSGRISDGKMADWRKSSVHPTPFEPFTAP